MTDWEFAILTCINDLGKEVMLQQIYGRIGSYVPLTEDYLRATVHGGRPAYQHEVRSYISNLCEKGDLLRVDIGCYSLTEQGKKRIELITDKDLDDL
jgi:hypothetical protein